MNEQNLRQSVLPTARRIVVKVGSQLLTNDTGELDLSHARALGDQISALIRAGCDVTLVSSGSVAVGRMMLGLDRRPKDLGVLQSIAAVGQSGLMSRWSEIFARHDIHVAQMLLTQGDFEDRNRYLNIRNCLTELHNIPAVPIINENDTVAVDELRLGDNDILAALLTNALCADLLVLLSTVDGLKDRDGRVVDQVDDALEARSLVHSDVSNLGTGGMQTKLEAARMVTEAGETAAVANGRAPDVLGRLLKGEPIGTVFAPAHRKLEPRRRWIGQAVRPAGVIVVDDGAAGALLHRGKSLLATGITEVTGRFDKGDVVVVRDRRGREVARGLTNYGDEESRTIAGQRSDRFEQLLGRRAYDEVIHRDNLVVTGAQGEAETAHHGGPRSGTEVVDE